MQNKQFIPTDDRYYRTAHFGLAALLLTKDQVLVNADKTNPKKVIFVFRNTPELEEIYRDYNFGPPKSSNTQVDVRKYEVAMDTLKRVIYEVNPFT